MPGRPTPTQSELDAIHVNLYAGLPPPTLSHDGSANDPNNQPPAPLMMAPAQPRSRSDTRGSLAPDRARMPPPKRASQNAEPHARPIRSPSKSSPTQG